MTLLELYAKLGTLLSTTPTPTAVVLGDIAGLKEVRGCEVRESEGVMVVILYPETPPSAGAKN